MAQTLLIGIGGSGAKGVESFVHLCAAGLGPADRTSVALVDQDAANGNTERALKALGQYRALRRHLRRNDKGHDLPDGVGLLATEIGHPAQPLWCPLEGDSHNLETLFYANMLRPQLKGLFDALFAPEEQVLPLDRGFRGRPHIGAAVLTAQAECQKDHPFWREIDDAIAAAKNGTELRVFLVGSIFGGTGAAGFPTLAREIRRRAIDGGAGELVKIGGALLLPYFQFGSERDEQDVGPAADSTSFIGQTQAALPYYESLMAEQVFDNLYMFGWDRLLQVARRPSGGRDQFTPPLMPELYAALAATHFFAAEAVTPQMVLRADRQDPEKVGWPDLPARGADRREVQKGLGGLARFAFSYLAQYAPTLGQQIQQGWFKESWFKNLILARGITLNDGDVQDVVSAVTQYCRDYLAWLAGLVLATRAGGSSVDLIDTELFAKWADGQSDNPVEVAIPADDTRRQLFTRLVSNAKGASLSDIWRAMGSAHADKARPLAGKGLGVFFGRLYQEAAITGFDDGNTAGTAPAGTALATLPLPRASSDVPVIKTVGWGIAGDRTLFRKIATALDSGGLILSIPDVWATEALSRDLLSKVIREGHPRHGQYLRARGEWRGLLACLALVPEELADIATDSFNLDVVASAPFDGAVGLKPGEADFGQVCARTRPSPVSLAAANWRDLGLIRIEGQVVGLLTPTFLVGCGRRPLPASTRLGWVVDGHPGDPCLAPASAVSVEELLTIAEYCDSILDVVKQGPAGDANLFNPLRGLLQEFAADARAAVAARGVRADGVVFDPYSARLPVPAYASFLTEKLKRLRPSAVPTDLRLVLSESARSALAGDDGTARVSAVLVDESWAGSQTMAGLRVWRTTAVETFLARPDLRERIRGEMAEQGVVLLTPDDIFTPILCEVTSPILTHPPGFANHLLPLTPLAMALFDVGDSQLALVKTGNGLKVTLKLRVVDREGTPHPVTVERLYPKALPSDAPELYRWPNFEYAGWPWHFVFARHPKTLDLGVRDVLRPQVMLRAILTDHDPRQRVRRLWELSRRCDGSAERYDRMTESTSEAAPLFTTTDPVPAVVMDYRLTAANVPPGMAEGTVLAGVVLMPPSVVPEFQDGDWQIGIDFGTTNSCVYAAPPGRDPKPLPLTARARSPFPPPKGDVADDEYYVEFIPAHDLAVPFMTVMWARSDDEAHTHNRPVLTYTLHNTVNPWRSIDWLKRKANHLRYDLKWRHRGTGERDGVADFLALVIMHATAEAIAAGIRPERIEWMFSFPQAFHGGKLPSFKQSCRMAVTEVLGAFANPIEPALVDRSWRSESETSALYFADKLGVGLNGTVVTLDMGGGTTDVSIWQRDAQVWRNSVELAGRNILIDYLLRNRDLLVSAVRSDPSLAKAAAAALDLDRSSWMAGVETVVNSRGFDACLRRVANDHGLMAFTRLAMCGLLYYVGQVLASLYQGEKLQVRQGLPITLCLGGKLSKLLASMFPDTGDEKWIRTMLAAGANGIPAGQSKAEQDGPVGAVKVVFSEHPKQEVAYGLVVTPERERLNRLKIDGADRGLVLGEVIMVGGRPLPATTVDGEDTLPADRPWDVPTDLPVFADFLRQVRSSLRVRLSVGENAMAEIRDAMDASLSDGHAVRSAMRRDEIVPDPESTLMAPPFIVALRGLLERVARKDSDITFEPLP